MSQSPYPTLHRYLACLRQLGVAQDDRPMFDAREAAVEEAERRTASTGVLHVATPVWRIDHKHLEKSEPVAWSYTVNVI